MESNKKRRLYADPPGGWMYGFPKVVPDNVQEMYGKDFDAWLISEGYPKEKVKYWKDTKFHSVPCQMWFEPEEEVANETAVNEP